MSQACEVRSLNLWAVLCAHRAHTPGVYGHSWVSSHTDGVDELEAPGEREQQVVWMAAAPQGEWANSLYMMGKGLELLIGVSRGTLEKMQGCMEMRSSKVGAVGSSDWREGRDLGLQAECHTREFGPVGSREAGKVSVQ